MKTIILAVMAAVGFLAFASPAEAACLEITRNNTFSHWNNTCNREVHVNWTDGESCRNWGCTSSLKPNQKRSTATISRKTETRWCEAYDGARAKGPCDGAAAPPMAAPSAPTPSVADQPEETCAEKRDLLARYEKGLPNVEAALRQSQAVIDIYNSNGQQDSTGYAHYHMEEARKAADLIARARVSMAELERDLASC